MQQPEMPTLQPELQNVIESQADRWRHCEGQADSTLLRLSILREVMRELHAQKSRCLAKGQRDMAKNLRAWENRLTELRSQPKLEGDLSELVLGKSELRKRTRLLPEALYGAIPREKLERYDRQWESNLAAEACALGWRFWSLEAWVEITLAEEWNRRLNDQIWPSALVLYTESAESTPPIGKGTARPPSTAVSTDMAVWRGRWILVADPRFKTPAEMSTAAASNMAQWPGSPPEPPSQAQWKLLFSPKMR
jgi:hypothetical protein